MLFLNNFLQKRNPISILCEDGTLDIVSTAVSPNTNSTYLWTTVNGNILQGANTPSPEINQ